MATSIFELPKKVYNSVRQNINSVDFILERNIRKRYRAILNPPEQKAGLICDQIKFGLLEINTDCNLNCIMCSSGLCKRKHMFMDLQLFEKIIATLKARGIASTPIHLRGEPLFNPRLEDYFKILRKHKMKIMLSTNAQLLDYSLDLLCRYSDIIHVIRFSIDGATKETYEKIRRPGKFDRLIENLELFKEVNDKGKYFKDIYIDSIVSEDVKDELAYHLKFYSRYVDMHKIHLNLLTGLPPDFSYLFSNSILKKYIKVNRTCAQIYEGMTFLSDGRVVPCCLDCDGELAYGNINDNTPEQLINNGKMIQLRTYYASSRFPKDSSCAKCYGIDTKVSVS